MSQKPLVQRLDEIDAKLSKLVESSKAISDFTIDLDSIKHEINHEIASAFLRLQGASSEWNEVITYCNTKTASPRKVLMMLHALHGELDTFSPINEKEAKFINDIRST